MCINWRNCWRFRSSAACSGDRGSDTAYGIRYKRVKSKEESKDQTHPCQALLFPEKIRTTNKQESGFEKYSKLDQYNEFKELVMEWVYRVTA